MSKKAPLQSKVSADGRKCVRPQAEYGGCRWRHSRCLRHTGSQTGLGDVHHPARTNTSRANLIIRQNTGRQED